MASRVLIVSPSLPLPFGTAHARWLSVLVQELASRGIEVVCLVGTDESEERMDAALRLARERGYELQSFRLHVPEPAVLRKVRSLRTPFSEFLRQPELRRRFEQELAAGPDVVHVEYLFPSRLAVGVPQGIAFVHNLDTVDWEGRTGLSARDRLTRWQMKRATRQILGRLPHLAVGTERIRSEISVEHPHLDITVIPTALDPRLYEPVEPLDEPVAGLIGSMHWHPSRSAAERLLTRIWPEVHQRVPGSRLLVGGWESKRRLGSLFPLDGAELVGEVDDHRDFFSRLALVVYPPPNSTGVKIKTLEALAFGLPVVSNAAGLEGIEVIDGVSAVRAESDKEFIEATVGLLSDPARRHAIAAAARRVVETTHDPTAIIDRLLETYDRVLPGGRSQLS